MIGTIWDAIMQSGDKVVEWMGEMFAGMAALFYVPGTTASDPGQLTFLGICAIIALTVGVAFVIIKWISSFVTLNRH